PGHPADAGVHGFRGGRDRGRRHDGSDAQGPRPVTELARIEVERRGDRTVVSIDGEVDMSNAAELGAAVSAAVPNGARELVVDLTATTYLDCVEVSLLLR